MSARKSWESKYPAIAFQWNYEKNDIPIESSLRKDSFWWKCSMGHEWKASIHNRIYGKSCPYCSGSLPCDTNNLAVKSPHLLKKWDYEKNSIKPTEILSRSIQKVWWKCDKEHSWKTSPHNMNNIKIKNGCPVCASNPSKYGSR